MHGPPILVLESAQVLTPAAGDTPSSEKAAPIRPAFAVVSSSMPSEGKLLAGGGSAGQA